MEVKTPTEKKCFENSDNMESFNLIYKSRKNILDILKSLDYNTEEYQNFSSSELNHMINYNQLDMIIKNNSLEKQIYVKFFEIGQNKILNKSAISEMYEDLFELENILNSNDILFIIYNCEPNDSCKQQLKHIWESKKYLVSVINISRLQFNILEHTLYVPHIILNNDEKNDFKNKFNILEDSLIPEISRFDPVAQIIGIKPGEVCKIIRNSKSAVESNYYRICVNK